MSSALERISVARRELELATSFDDVRRIRDTAEAFRAYAQAAGMGLEAMNQAAELKLRAERKAGEMLSEMPKNPGGRSTSTTVVEVGVSHNQSSRWQRIASVPEESFEDYLASAQELTTAGLLKLAKRASYENTPKVVPMPTGRYSVVVSDPPWQYGNRATRGAAEDHYPTMTIDELCALPVDEWVAEEAHLYLWTTNGFLREAFQVVDAWGFAYKTCLTWVKPQIGLGNYFRNNTEHVLFGVRGGLRTQARDVPTAFEARRGRHSAKPGMFYDLVEKCSPGPYLEMFARSQRFNWDSWGNEALEHVEVAS